MRRLTHLLAALLLVAARPAPIEAQRIALETLVDFELWKTSDSSRLLARNKGDAFGEARMHAWFRYRLAESLELRTIGRISRSTETGAETQAALEQASLRFVQSRAFALEGGRVLYPMGTFGARRFSNANPLIGAPDMYPTQYPTGFVASGALGSIDYRAAFVDLPLVNIRYTPEPGARVRPVLGVGLRTGPRLHLGVSGTSGPYLSDRVSSRLPSGAEWGDFAQTIVAADARFSAGYFEARTEAAWSSYEVPTQTSSVKGFGWYGEVRGTVSPRVFLAARFEDFNYPFILPISSSNWLGRATRQRNAELGAGYRVSADALIKVSFRKDHWPVQTTSTGARFPNGYAFGLQFSLHSDLAALIEGKY
jgi:hypothetical protein